MFKKNKIKTINKASIGDHDVLVMMVMMIIAEQMFETNNLNQT